MEQTNTTNTQPAALAGKKILIVEDDVFLGQVLARYMEGEQMSTRQVKSAEEAIIAVEKEIPDIIVLDIYLPGISGLEFLEKLRSDEKTKKIPVMVVSNASQLEERNKAESLGAAFFVKALVSPQEIFSNIKKTLSPQG